MFILFLLTTSCLQITWHILMTPWTSIVCCVSVLLPTTCKPVVFLPPSIKPYTYHRSSSPSWSNVHQGDSRDRLTTPTSITGKRSGHYNWRSVFINRYSYISWSNLYNGYRTCTMGPWVEHNTLWATQAMYIFFDFWYEQCKCMYMIFAFAHMSQCGCWLVAPLIPELLTSCISVFGLMKQGYNHSLSTGL